MTFEYVVKKNRSMRGVRISVHQDGRVLVSKPWFVTNGMVEKYVEERRVWIESKLEHFKQNPVTILSKGGKKEYLEHRADARRLVLERLVFFNTYYNFSFKKVSIKNQRTRWGSCSKRGNLNFNYKIFFLPPDLCDYIIVHELCHLRELNHGKNFWKLVSEKIPDYKSKIKKLKKIR